MSRPLLSAGAARAGGGRYLHLNPVRPGSHPPQRCAARIGGDWYFASRGRLFVIPADLLARPGADLSQAREVPLPPGRVRGLIPCRGWLTVALQGEGEPHTTLWCGAGEGLRWEPCLELTGEPSQFCRAPAGKEDVVFFALNPDDKDQAEPRPIFYSTDGRRWLVFDHVHATEAQHLHSLTCREDQLLLLVGDQHFRHLTIRAFDQAGKLVTDPAGRHRRYLGLAEHSLYHALPGPAGQTLFALDGPTVLLDSAGRVVFQDQAPGNSGFQVAAHGCFASRPEVLLFGTWRRDPAHPFPCLYVAAPRALYKYVNQSQPFTEATAWTGYQCNDATLLNLGGDGEHGFWPGFGCESLYFSLLNPEQAEALLRSAQGLAVTPSPGAGQAALSLPALLDLG